MSFRECLSNPLFVGYQLSGTFSFCGVFVYISTVAFFLRDVFDVSTEFFGVVFAMTAAGFIVGSLSSSRLVLKWGADRTLRRGAFICALSTTSALLTLINPDATKALLALISILFFFGVGLIAPNASMGAVSLYSPQSRRCICGLRKRSFRCIGNRGGNCWGNVRWQNAGTDHHHVCVFSGCINRHHDHTPPPGGASLNR